MEDQEVKLHPYGVLILNDKVGVVADLHIGYESNYISLINVQTKLIYDRLKAVVEDQGIKQLIINGDVKHSFTKESIEEWGEVKKLFERLCALTDVVVIKGNHDNYVETMLSKTDVVVKKRVVVDGWLIEHGHEKSRDGEKGVIIGHEHPAITLRDEVGGRQTFPCFLHIKAENVWVLPSMNPWTYGSNMLSQQTTLSPYLNRDNLLSAHVYATDFERLFDFGTINQIKQFLRCD